MLELNYARRARRHAVDLPCELIHSDYDDPINHRMCDLSAYGAWIQTTFPLEIGHGVVLAFRPMGIDLTLFGEVMRTVRPRQHSRMGCLAGAPRTGMGVEFVGLTRHDRAELLAMLRQLPDAALEMMRFARAARIH